MFPNDSITVFEEVQGAITVNVSTSDPSTILSVAVQQENNSSDTQVRCGSDIVAKNYATNFSQVTMLYECNDFINISKTGNDKASVIITYVPYHLSEVPPPFNPTTNIASSTDIAIYGSFTGGEVLIALFLFLLICLELVKGIARGLGNIQTGKKFLQYYGGDVEVRRDL